MISILIVEDERAISNLIRLSLSKAGYDCFCAAAAQEAKEMLEGTSFDLILLDVMLPDASGFELMDFIRPLDIPVIFLTARNQLEDRVHGLAIGAEDYIVKPFEVIELLARVDVVLRRCKKAGTCLEIEGLNIDVGAMRVSRDGKEIFLTPKEYDLLLLFARNPNVALYRETIYERVWGGDYDSGNKTVALHVQRLRKKVGWEQELQAVNKIGYRLVVK